MPHVIRLEDTTFLADMVRGKFLEGECYAFAIGMHHALGWPLVGLMEGKVIRHAAVKSPDGTYLDARGIFQEDDFGVPFGIAENPEIHAITEEQLRGVKTTTIYETSITCAERMAQALWPDLPWLPEKSLLKKNYAFLAELEELSQKHGIWIRSPFPTTRPILTEAHGDEEGYLIEPSNAGFNHAFDRRLKGQHQE